MEDIKCQNYKKVIELIRQINSQVKNKQERLQLLKDVFIANAKLFDSDSKIKELLFNTSTIFSPKITSYYKKERQTGNLMEQQCLEDAVKWAVCYARYELYVDGKLNLTYLGDCKKSSQIISTATSVYRYQLKDLKDYKVDTSKLFGKNFQHSINIVEGAEKRFLVDPTFVQFFNYFYSLEEFRTVVPKNCIPVGAWLIADDTSLEIVNELIEKGYIEATDEVIKRYFDAFVLANDKNRASVDDNSTDYSASDYIELIKCGSMHKQKGN